jgi:hypothetical protein
MPDSDWAQAFAPLIVIAWALQPAVAAAPAAGETAQAFGFSEDPPQANVALPATKADTKNKQTRVRMRPPIEATPGSCSRPRAEARRPSQQSLTRSATIARIKVGPSEREPQFAI